MQRHQRRLGLFCSVRCPGELIVKAYDFACSARDAGTTIVSGFHTPVERDCLRLLLKGTQAIVLCAARSVEDWRLPAHLLDARRAGRLAVVSPFAADVRRVTAKTAEHRNRYVASLVESVLVVYASPGGRVEALAGQLLANGKQVLTFNSPYNANLLAAGATPTESCLPAPS